MVHLQKQPIEIVGVTQSILKNIRTKILTGELRGGEKLNETELSKKFNISRPPLREAFRMLEKEDLAFSIPRRGCYVSNTSSKDAQQISEAREMIECFSIDILKQHNITEVSSLFSALDSGSKIAFSRWLDVDKVERLKYLRILANFHTKLVELAGNELLIRFHQTITHKLARYQFMYPYDQSSFEKSQKEHDQIAELIKVGDFRGAKKYLKNHTKPFYALLQIKLRQ